MMIHDLRDELLIMTFSQLSIRDLGSVNCVDQKWYEIGNDTALWKRHAEKLTCIATNSWCSQIHRFDFTSTKSIKEQIKDSQISIPNAKIFPIFQSMMVDNGSILSVGRIDFTFTKLQADQKLNIAKQALTYLPENSYLTLWNVPGGELHTVVFKKDDKIDAWSFECDTCNPMCGPSDADQQKLDALRKTMTQVSIERDDKEEVW